MDEETWQGFIKRHGMLNKKCITIAHSQDFFLCLHRHRMVLNSLLKINVLQRRIDVLMSLPEHKLRHLLSLQENSFEQRELFEVRSFSTADL